MEKENIPLHFDHLEIYSSILAFTKINISHSTTENVQQTETSIKNNENVFDETKIKKIIDFIGDTVLDNSKIPIEIQEKIKTEFSEKEQPIISIIIQKTYPSHMGKSLADSLVCWCYIVFSLTILITSIS